MADRRDLLDLTVRDVLALLDAALRPSVVAAQTPSADPPVWLDAAAAGRYLGLHERTIRRAAETGALRAARVGRLWRFKAAWLDTWIEAGGRRG